MNQHPASIILVGRPNVGKSTLFNRLIGRREAIEHGEAHTTRDLVRSLLHFGKKSVELVDSAGDVNKTTDEIIKLSQLQKKKVMQGITLILFIIDAIEGITAEDERILREVRKLNKPFLIVANKADNAAIEENLLRQIKFEKDKLFFVSAIHNIGVFNLIEYLKGYAKPFAEEKRFAVAVLGRPNAGKSTLVNAISNSDISIVSDIAGTTRDLVKIDVGVKNKLQLIDTAGLGRRAKSMKGVNRYSTLRIEKTLGEVDCVMLVIDLVDGIAVQDLKIANAAITNGASVILVLNKLDRIEEDQDSFIDKQLDKLIKKFSFAPYIPVVFISAKEKKNIAPLIQQIKEVKKNRAKRIDDQTAKNLLFELQREHQSFIGIKSLIQDNINPPQFVLETNKRIARHHLKHIINTIRTKEKIELTPIQLIVKERLEQRKPESVTVVTA